MWKELTSRMLWEPCGVSCVVQSIWCYVCRATYAVQSMWHHLCVALHALRSIAPDWIAIDWIATIRVFVAPPHSRERRVEIEITSQPLREL